MPCNECVFSVSDRTLSKYGTKNCVKQIKVKLLCKQLARLKMYPKEIEIKKLSFSLSISPSAMNSNVQCAHCTFLPQTNTNKHTYCIAKTMEIFFI